MKTKPPTIFDPQIFLSKPGKGRTISEPNRNQRVFSQGDAAAAVFYILKGKVTLSVISRQGKEALTAILGSGDFFGEACLAGQKFRVCSATAATDSRIMCLERAIVLPLLHNQPAFAALFLRYILARNMRIEEDLVDQLFNSSEKRLARLLLLLANVDENGKPAPVIPKLSQEMLARMVGTTRSRISFFMNRFRALGFIEYKGDLYVHNSLLNVVLRDSIQSPGGKVVGAPDKPRSEQY